MAIKAFLKTDGYSSFLGGQDSAMSPILLREDQVSQAWNCTSRGAKNAPRPGFRKLDFTFSDDESEEWFLNQKNQGDICYRYLSGQTIQVWSVGGRIFTVDVNNNNLVSEITPTATTSLSAGFTVPAVGSNVVILVTDASLIRAGYPIYINGKTYSTVSISGSSVTVENVNDTPAAIIALGGIVTYLDVNSPILGIAYMIQAEEFLIIQDGLSKPIIWDGGSIRRSDTEAREVPSGTVMAYGIGRLWVATQGNRYVASDIVYGPTGTAPYEKRDAILKFTENTFLTGGGFFTAPGNITAMQFISSLDTSTGQGPLMVFTEEAICSVNAPTQRELWAVVTNPIQTISLLANGAMSFYGTIPTVNGDIFYRALDGVRSFYAARREFGTWGNTPISTEIDNLIIDDAEDLLKYHSAILFDNRLLFTGRPIPDRGGAYWTGIGALDFDPMSSMQGKTPPVYDGIWTGVNPVYLFTGKYGRVQRAFIAAINSDNENELWEVSKGDRFEDDDKRIKRTIITRAFASENPLEWKRLENLELWLLDAVGDVDITVRYRPDEYPCWFEWKSQAMCVAWRKCTSYVNCATPKNFQNGYKTRICFGQPPDTDETNDGKPARIGFVHQLEIVIEGYCVLQKFRIMMTPVDEQVNPRVDLPETCQEINCCPTDYYEWRSDEATDAGGFAQVTVDSTIITADQTDV